ncbi:hypothetical protein [Larkinella arboricola]
MTHHRPMPRNLKQTINLLPVYFSTFLFPTGALPGAMDTRPPKASSGGNSKPKCVAICD